MIIRAEAPQDAEAVAEVIESAFGQLDEARLVADLQKDDHAVISLVALVGERIIGHILFSPMTGPFPALGLAPLSVAPPSQAKGVGSALVHAGLEAARRGDWRAVFVLGDPAYYRRFGFSAELAQGFASPYAGPHLMALALKGELPTHSGAMAYAPAFAALS